MPNFFLQAKKIILLVGDIAMFFLALYLTLVARYGWEAPIRYWGDHFLPFSAVFSVWLVVFFIHDFYDLKISYNHGRLLNLLIKLFIINGVMAVITFYFFSPFFGTIKPQRVLLIDLAFSFGLIFAWRRFFFTFIKSANIANKILIIGRAPLANLLLAEINHREQLGYKAELAETMPEDLKNYCLTHHVNILINANDLRVDNEAARKIFDCLSLGIDVYNIYNFYEQITNRVPVEYLDHSWFLENLAEHSKKLYSLGKRTLDIFLAMIGLAVAIPLSPFIALIIKLESPGPIIFKQIRTGKNNKTFLAMKFRSMIADAEKNGPQWAAINDPRVTRWGAFMRKTRLDEIPQLINILLGEMSFVGPRPERPEFVAILAQEIPFYQERLLVKPGLTGWAQLNGPAYGGSKEESLEKMKYDLYYIKNRSLLLDISILLKTIRVALSGRGR